MALWKKLVLGVLVLFVLVIGAAVQAVVAGGRSSSGRRPGP